MIPTVFPAARYSCVSRLVSVLFPAPGGPVNPMRQARPSRGCYAASNASKPGRRFSTMLTTRASAAARPAVKSPSSFSCAGVSAGWGTIVVTIA